MDKITIDIINRLTNIVIKRFQISKDSIDEKYMTEDLLGSKCQISPICLVYLFYDVESEFNIKLPEEEIANGKFNTINNIATLIANQL